MSEISLGATGKQVLALNIVVSALCSAHKTDETFLYMVNSILDGATAHLSADEAEPIRRTVNGIISP